MMLLRLGRGPARRPLSPQHRRRFAVGVSMLTHCGALASATGALWSATAAVLITMHWGALASPTVIREFGVVKSMQ